MKIQQHIMKWNGKVTENFIQEKKGNRQGGMSSAEEWKVYNNAMIADIEKACTENDMIENLQTNCVTVADDVVPTVTGDTGREAVHELQLSSSSTCPFVRTSVNC